MLALSLLKLKIGVFDHLTSCFCVRFQTCTRWYEVSKSWRV